MTSPKNTRAAKEKSADKNTAPAEATPTQTNTPDAEKAAAPVKAEPANPAEHDETDVRAALSRTTQDGKGEHRVPESDFHSFATSGVREGEDTTAVDYSVIASDVLAGKWGAGEEKRERLEAAGHNPTEVAKEVNRRLTGGAPNVFPTSLRDDAVSVIRGEWGAEEDEIKGNLNRAGKEADEIWAERNRQLGLAE